MARYIDADRFRSAMWYSFGESDSYIERGMAKWDGGLWVRYKAVEEVLDAQPAADVIPSDARLVRFAEWVADWILRKCFEDCAGGFAELACRRLEKLGIMRKDGNLWMRNEVENG